jgi:peptide/nickel transport system permease protein
MVRAVAERALVRHGYTVLTAAHGGEAMAVLETGTKIDLIVSVLALTGWMGVCRIVRGQILSLSRQDFVQAARALGLSPLRIIARHLVPNALAPVIVYASLAVGSTILVEASLSFLGIGISPPTPTWGSMVSEGRKVLMNAPLQSTVPGLFIVWAVLSFNLLGDGLRDALDPRFRGR